jgi:hypothetical protein
LALNTNLKGIERPGHRWRAAGPDTL